MPSPASYAHRYMMKSFMGGGNKGGQQGGANAPVLTPRLQKLTPVDVHFFVSEGESWRKAARGEPIWVASDVQLGGPDSPTFTYTYHPSEVSGKGQGEWPCMIKVTRPSARSGGSITLAHRPTALVRNWQGSALW